MNTTEDDFLAWIEHPVTQEFRQCLEKAAEDEKNAWVAGSWDGQKADQGALTMHKAVAYTLIQMANMDYANFKRILEK